MTPPPVAQVVHVAPGRLRMRVPAMRRNTSFLTQLARSMEQTGTLGNVHVNSLTGTILIEGSQLSVGQVRDIAHARKWLEIVARSRAPQRRVHARSYEPETMSTMIHGRDLASLAFLALAALQAARGQLLPPALSLLLYALDSMRRHGGALVETHIL